MATVSPSWNYTLHLPHDPRAPGIARGTLRLILAAHEMPELVPTAELLAAELLANSHCHTKGPYALRVRSAEPGRLRVAVWDTDPRVPPGFSNGGSPAPPPDAEHGRGLPLVRACADAWGASVLRELGASKGGKLLWAECGGGAAAW
ncbi:anti-sigma regulatory factor (Ser/Thr protein kinase) [Streptomyces africanus]|uniref:Anti-sigma regulatory factor (Ser/Thr protein kinase) n=1 Tax=Streptomyces africanus TaxID=231024 RepID=A0ABU0QP85_9ACTN|nr:ATP-binding protein [Streptomyces africanus]MDQ0749210.1 anti-sigma regulatory factor (Ser/Thr protein kinase) [Streptomyces africanus]